MEHGDASCVLGDDRPTAETTGQEASDPTTDGIAMNYRQPEPDAESLL